MNIGMERSDVTEKFQGSESAPFIVDLSPTSCPCIKTPPGGLTDKIEASRTIMNRKEGKRKRLRLSKYSGGGMSCCVIIILLFLILGQFIWTMTLQFSVLRVLDKLQAVEKLADTALTLTTDVAASAAKTAAQAASAANKAIEAVVFTGLAKIQNLTEGEILLTAAKAATQQAQAAAAAAKEYALSAETAKNKALEVAASAKQSVEAAAEDLKKSFKSIFDGRLTLSDPVSKGEEDLVADIPDEQLKVTASGQPSVALNNVTSDRDDSAVNQSSVDNGEIEDQHDVNKGEEDQSRSRRSLVDMPDAQRSLVAESRSRRSLVNLEESSRAVRHSGPIRERRSPKVKDRASRSKKKRKETEVIHLQLTATITHAQQGLLNSGAEKYIALDNGRVTRGGYYPYPNQGDDSSDCPDCHLYKEWSVMDSRGRIRYNRSTGHITVIKPGFYHVYAQIYYRNSAVRSGFKIEKLSTKNNPAESDDKSIAVCMTSTNPNSTGSSQPQHEGEGGRGEGGRGDDNPDLMTCYTSTVVYLERDDSVYMIDFYSRRIALNMKAANMFGMYKVSD